VIRFFSFVSLLFVISCNNASAPLMQEMKNTGIDFENKIVNTKEFNIFNYRNFYNGGGVAIGDLNNDGLTDVFFTANMGSNKLYLNKGGWKFEDISESAGFKGKKKWSTGVAMVDINQDGFLDIYVCNAGYQAGVDTENELWINDGKMHFTDQAAAYGLNDDGFTTHAAFFDYDADGDLDCYILNNSFIPVNTLNYSNKRGLRAKDWPVEDGLKGGGDKLLRNDGGKFIDVSEQAGIYGSLIGFGLGVTVGDVNGDLKPDIYVSNDFFERDYLYINKGDGTFSEELTKRIQHTSHSSMGADMADLDNDGANEIFVTEMLPDDDKKLKMTTSFESFDVHRYKVKSDFYYQFMQNTLQKNNGTGVFSDVAFYSGVAASDWSWGALLFDLNNDGLKDIYVCNGIYHDLTDQDFINYFANEVVQDVIMTGKKQDDLEIIKAMPSRPIKNKLFINKGEFKFDDAGGAMGITTASFSNGSAYGDLDNDGDLDLIVNNLNQPAFVYKNNSREINKRHYIGIKLFGDKANRFAIGSKVEIYQNGTKQTCELMPNRGFQSSVDLKMIFGLANNPKIDSLKIYWPNSTYRTITNLRADSVYQFYYLKDDKPFVPFLPVKTLFTTVLEGQLDVPEEDNYIDIHKERNMMRLISKEGPRAAIADVNGDGKEDVFIGGAATHAAKLYIQTSTGFSKTSEDLFYREREPEDVAVDFFDADQDGDMDLFVGSGGNNHPTLSKPMMHRLYLNDGKGNFSKKENAFPLAIGNTSVVLVKDIDGDGDKDIFTASSSVPMQYGILPEVAFYINDGTGVFNLQKNIVAQIKPGMYNSAVYADLNGDKKDELVLVGEWTGVEVYELKAGVFKALKTSLSTFYGWWRAVSTADLDGDGDQDLVLGNNGGNHYLKPDEKHPVKMWLNLFEPFDKQQLIMTRTVNGKDVPVFMKKELTDRIQSLNKQNLRHEEYAKKAIQDLFSKEIIKSSQVSIYNYVSSCIAWNDGNGKFVLQVLPFDAQLSSINAIQIADVNSDRKLDLLLGNNQYDWLPQFSRMDAGYGGVLINNGNRSFSFLPAAQSGIQIVGQTRDIKPLSILGKASFLFIQNNSAPLIYQYVEK
jgi:hypothetical protein